MSIISLKKIKEIIPQRYPMLMLDRAEKQSDTKFIGVKNITINENVFQRTFPWSFNCSWSFTG